MIIRRYILFAILILTGTVLMAQPRLDKPEIFLGAHGGVKASTMLFSPSVKQLDILHSPLTPNGGLVFRYAEHKVCALQVECNYMQNGWAEVYGTEASNQTIYTRKLHYIQVPFLMHLGFGRKGFRGFFNLGPQIGFCVADQSYWSNTNALQQNQLQHQPIDNKFDWGAAAGLGCYYKSQKAGVFQLEARFHFSLGGAFDVGQLEHFKMANPMGISLNLGYLWEFKKNK
ncbi:MAG: PorT family protein [Paludibacteraceae bacterium]|nr:PorT family protein [Paludibacteraceae bacterium]